MTADDVQVLWRTPGVVSATARDSSGVFDVRWSVGTGWHCTCGSDDYHSRTSKRSGL